MLGREGLVTMNSCVFTLIWGSLLIVSRCGFARGSCDTYTNVTDTWRNKYFTSSSFTGYPNNDAPLIGSWCRFTGIGGDTVITSCLNGPIGGTLYPIYLSFNHPTTPNVTTTGTASSSGLSCGVYTIGISVILCPGGFYIYKLDSHSLGSMAFVTYHSECNTDSCGPLGNCSDGGCRCVSGYEIPSDHRPTTESYGCVDIDECVQTAGICGSYSTCTNTIGTYSCACVIGFQATDLELSPGNTNPCIDIDECLTNICGDDGVCTNNIGSFFCTCNPGYEVVANATPICQDIDECLDLKICGPKSVCANIPGAYTCSCKLGYASTIRDEEPSKTNICIDIDECLEEAGICGPNANCSNSIGSYFCTCHSGYRLTNAAEIASVQNPCIDIDECKETPDICGDLTVCTNSPGSFFCSCSDGFYPSTGILWIMNISYCKDLQLVLNEMNITEGQTKEKKFLDEMGDQLTENKNIMLPPATVANGFSASMEVSGVGPRARSNTVSSEGNAKIGSLILGLSARLVTAMVVPGQEPNETVVRSPTVDLMLQTLGPGESNKDSSLLSANGNTMQINLEGLAKNNNDSASAAFFTLNGMESLLSHQYFTTENRTEMYSDVINAFLPLSNNTNLTQPVNFTIYHKKRAISEPGLVTCVYWEGNSDEESTLHWSVDGCSVAFTNENYTVCSCSHLSTFALILQIWEPPPSDPFLDWLGRVCVIIGLFFFGLAILTFLLCSWNPKINNTARLHLCLNLAMSHLLLLWNDRYVDQELACIVMAGVLHFLIVASFVWMLLEAFQLYLLVRRLTKVQVIQRDGLPKPLLYLIGYGVPFVIVGVSALVYSDGYGATGADVCWLSNKRNFNWALTGPVIAVLGLNCILFLATLWSLRPTLANMKSDVSQSKDTRLIVFKILAQFVILGCTWILGLYQTNLFFQVLFIVLNSQQGTFLFIVHCVLNKEVREEYIKLLTCSFNKPKPEGDSVKDVPSISEDMDKAEE